MTTSERRLGERYLVSFPIRVEWKNDSGQNVVEEGLTENVGPNGALVFLPRSLPGVGAKVSLIVTERKEEVEVGAEVLRVERNVSHPQAALQLTSSIRIWKEKVWNYAAKVIAEQEPEEYDDW
ncbi:MAG: PilZ domain-containing protein [Pyrinomonadaceae bacterium]